jgi:hypothetical protein
MKENKVVLIVIGYITYSIQSMSGEITNVMS